MYLIAWMRIAIKKALGNVLDPSRQNCAHRLADLARCGGEEVLRQPPPAS